ncbi:ADP-L-glycero-D-manno-heptose-6-epimerase [ANME-1 cluster archaeon GoMg3.2]|jgi:nucleoside-diphosphate-sugar epimerase|nr:ADP-L-glycero-D-manno-heptose-6-epimerase [ANME-1 cluster archaeon GoMg3.2]
MSIENEYEGKKILVTGGAGCIGTNLCRKLAELGAEKVVILDDLSSAYEWNIPGANNISFVNGSILDDEMLKRVFKEKPDFVFHLAAHFANRNSVDNPAEVKSHEILRD